MRIQCVCIVILLLLQQYDCAPGTFTWTPVPSNSFYAWQSAKVAAKELLNLQNPFPVVSSAGGSGWNASKGRYNFYRVYFSILSRRLRKCRAVVHWGRPEPHVDFPNWSRCWFTFNRRHRNRTRKISRG